MLVLIAILPGLAQHLHLLIDLGYVLHFGALVLDAHRQHNAEKEDQAEYYSSHSSLHAHQHPQRIKQQDHKHQQQVLEAQPNSAVLIIASRLWDQDGIYLDNPLHILPTLEDSMESARITVREEMVLRIFADDHHIVIRKGGNLRE